MTPEFDTISTAHDDCVDCDALVLDAKIMAKATGSTGATFGKAGHEATVRRDPVSPTIR